MELQKIRRKDYGTIIYVVLMYIFPNAYVSTANLYVSDFFCFPLFIAACNFALKKNKHETEKVFFITIFIAVVLSFGNIHSHSLSR